MKIKTKIKAGTAVDSGPISSPSPGLGGATVPGSADRRSITVSTLG